MKEMLDLLVDFFKHAHPVVQMAALLVCLFFIGMWMFLWMRERGRNARVREERAELKAELEKSRSHLARTKRKADKETDDLRVQLSEARAQSLQDHEKLQRAIPAFKRVIQENDELLAQMATTKVQYLRLEAELTSLRQSTDQHREMNEQSDTVRTQEDRSWAELADLRKRFDDLQRIDTDVWVASSSLNGALPRFVHRDKRKTRFVTFLNLKGGVGKTTIVANLAAAYATGVLGTKLRILAVDLDYQGTLSNLCVDQQFLSDRRSQRQTADRLIDGDLADGDGLNGLLAPMRGTAEMAMTIVADDELDQCDFRQQALYAIQHSEVRFHHRRLLHQPAVFEKFDFVFFDCPPRLTTSSINALAASDWIVVPTGLDPNDVEAVPRTLRWLEKLQTQAHVDFHAKLGGVILNATFRAGTTEELTKDERLALHQLRTAIKRFAPAGDPILTNVVKDDNAIARSAATNGPFGLHAAGHALYRDVALELYERIKN